MISFVFCVLVAENIVFPQQTDISLILLEGQSECPIVFFAPHQNEHVVNQYAMSRVARSGGRFAAISQEGTRHVLLRIGGETLEIDPNRFFTDIGIRSSLLTLNPALKGEAALLEDAMNRCRQLAAFVLEHLEVTPQSVVVALHNNTDGFDDDGKGGIGTISIHRYQARFRDGAKYILAVYVGDHDEDDLFFVTDRSDFDRMARAGFNVILQHPQVAHLSDEDDGSLSVYAEKMSWRYINIEAQRNDDHLQIQKNMVDFVYGLSSLP